MNEAAPSLVHVGRHDQLGGDSWETGECLPKLAKKACKCQTDPEPSQGTALMAAVLVAEVLLCRLVENIEAASRCWGLWTFFPQLSSVLVKSRD